MHVGSGYCSAAANEPGEICAGFSSVGFIVSCNATSSSDVVVLVLVVVLILVVVGWRPLSVCIFICGA